VEVGGEQKERREEDEKGKIREEREVGGRSKATSI
jgi:hypothetical protein